MTDRKASFSGSALDFDDGREQKGVTEWISNGPSLMFSAKERKKQHGSQNSVKGKRGFLIRASQ